MLIVFFVPCNKKRKEMTMLALYSRDLRDNYLPCVSLGSMQIIQKWNSYTVPLTCFEIFSYFVQKKSTKRIIGKILL